MINLIEALRMSAVALRDTSGGAEMLARRKAALEAAERALDVGHNFPFGEGAIEITLKTVRDGKLYGNRRIILSHHFSQYPPSIVVAHSSSLMWEDMEAAIKKEMK
jgi:hypothetical protein